MKAREVSEYKQMKIGMQRRGGGRGGVLGGTLVEQPGQDRRVAFPAGLAAGLGCGSLTHTPSFIAVVLSLWLAGRGPFGCGGRWLHSPCLLLESGRGANDCRDGTPVLLRLPSSTFLPFPEQGQLFALR